MKTLYKRIVESLPDMNNTDTKKSINIVKDLMTKYNLTDKDLFSFCICAVNFLEYYDEEAICDVMRECPKKYARADSDNTKAVAGALNGEKKAEGWTDEEQFFYYMECIQSHVDSDINNLSQFLYEFDRFEKVYRREIFVPIMLGCPVEDYDDSRFYDRKYLKSIANVNFFNPFGLNLLKKIILSCHCHCIFYNVIQSRNFSCRLSRCRT